jgi:hypothetical protein
LDIPEEGRNLVGAGARDQRRGHIFGLVARHAQFGLGRGAGRALDHPGLLEVEVAHVGVDLGQAALEGPVELGAIDVADQLAARLLGHAHQRRQARIEREQLAIVGAGARQVQPGPALVDELAAL